MLVYGSKPGGSKCEGPRASSGAGSGQAEQARLGVMVSAHRRRWAHRRLSPASADSGSLVAKPGSASASQARRCVVLGSATPSSTGSRQWALADQTFSSCLVGSVRRRRSPGQTRDPVRCRRCLKGAIVSGQFEDLWINTKGN
uniref:Uncharacterized protein n=1 Tax=Sphaerodactylus townsendi TaxID=933632 RepID=A0ACB8E7E1_9SAUR